MRMNKAIETIYVDQEKNPLVKDHCACKLPSNHDIKKIVTMTRDIIFPGYFKDNAKNNMISKHALARDLKKLHRLLRSQISLALLYLADQDKDKAIERRSCVLCYEFIERIPYLRMMMQTDLEAHYRGDPAAYNHDQIVVSYPGFYAIMIYRMAHEMHLLKIPMLPRMMSEYAHRETGIDINPAATIGKHFFIDHGTGVVIGETTEIGDNVKIYQGVTLGALSTRGGQMLKGVKRHPTIGNGVTIYSNASILGKDTIIGDGSTIGSNVFITGSVPPNSRVSIRIPELVVKTQEPARKD